jgi:UDP-N-acetylglucosamine 1-carboxyvinyltransferase
MRIVVHGGQPLRGTTRPSGNNNAALALIAAALLTDQPVRLSNVPGTLSTASMLSAAGTLGAKVARQGGEVLLETPSLLTRALEQDLTESQVGAVLFLAPILARRRHARMEIPYPPSRLHTHLLALRDLGVNVRASSGVIEFEAAPWGQRTVTLQQPSVTATALAVMLAASLGQRTTILNAASEPHAQDLQRFLVAQGAQIAGIGSNVLHVQGVAQPGGAEYTVSPDHIEVASLAALGAITRGTLTVEGVVPDHLAVITRVYARLGIRLFTNGDTLILPAHDALIASESEEELDVPIETAPWPGFPSDLIAMTAVIATQTRGTTLIHEKLFDNRLLFVDKLASMGAQIVLCDPHRALIVGPSELRGEYLDTPDVRTGLALLGAALASSRSVTIDNAQLIERTFENALSKLVALGARLEVVQS